MLTFQATVSAFPGRPILGAEPLYSAMHPDSLQNNSTVKVVDFAPFLDGSDRQGVSNAILDSFKTTGFVYLMNHGLSQNMIDSMFFWVSPNDCIPKL